MTKNRCMSNLSSMFKWEKRRGHLIGKSNKNNLYISVRRQNWKSRWKKENCIIIDKEKRASAANE